MTVLLVVLPCLCQSRIFLENEVFLDELFDLRNKVLMDQELRTILTLDSMLLLLLLFI